MLRKIAVAWVVVGLAGRLTSAALSQAVSVSPMDCPTLPTLPVEVDCGTMTVPEDHFRPDGAAMEIAYARLHSVSDAPLADPVVYLNGGPGGPTLFNIDIYARAFAPLLQERDLILFDQRGTGFSRPSLDCPELNAYYLQGALQSISRQEDAANLTAALDACQDRLEQAGVNFSVFTTAQNAADVPLLVEALGYRDYNVIGVSYGTRLALDLMRDHPENIRSVVLDSSLPPQAEEIIEGVSFAIGSLEAFFAECEADPLCLMAYPELRITFERIVADLDAQPLTEEVEIPGGEVATVWFDGRDFASLASRMVSSAEGRARLPGLIYAVRDGITTDLLEQATDRIDQLVALLGKPGSGGKPAGMLVICHDFAPFVTASAVEAFEADVPESARFAVDQITIMTLPCGVFGSGQPAPRVNEPVTSSIPTLILSGDYDNLTPPVYAETTAESLPASQIVRFPYDGHAVMLNNPCGTVIAHSFLTNPTISPDTSCLVEEKSVPLVLTVSSTGPLARRLVAPLSAFSGLVVLSVMLGGLAALAARGQLVLKAGLRRIGWLYPALSVLLLTSALVIEEVGLWTDTKPLEFIAAIIPVVMAMQVAMVASPDGEPGLEILLACPRPVHWLTVERLMLVATCQFLIAGMAAGVSVFLLGEPSGAYALLGWLVPALLLGGLAAFISIRSRQAGLGAIVALLTWFTTIVGGRSLVIASGLEDIWVRPLNLVQPFLWMVDPYLPPHLLTVGDTLANWLIVAGLGLGLAGVALYRLGDAEWVLLGRRARRVKFWNLNR